MEILTYVIGVAAVVVGLLSAAFFSLGSRDLGLWTTCIAIVLVIIGGFCWYQDRLWKGDAEVAAQSEKNDLLPGDAPFPHIPVPPGRPPGVPETAYTLAPNEVALLLGSFVVSTPERSFTVLKLYGKDLLKLTLVDGNKVRIWADVWDDDGRLLVTIEDSRLRVNRNNTLPLLRPDAHTLVVQNERKEDVLSVELLNSRCIRIKGIFKAGGRYPVVIDTDEITFGPLVISGGMALHVRGKAIFEWPGSFQNKAYIGSSDAIPVDGAQLGMAVNDGAANVILRNHQGEEFSLFQVGGAEVPPGTELWPAFSFRLRPPGTY